MEDTLNQIFEEVTGAENLEAKTNIVSEIIGCGASSQPALKSDKRKSQLEINENIESTYHHFDFEYPKDHVYMERLGW